MGNDTNRVNTAGGYNIAIGHGSLFQNTASHCTATGYLALTANTSASYNDAFGSKALQSNTTGDNNTALGYAAAKTQTTGTRNVAVGFEALSSLTTSSYNTVVGFKAGSGITTGSGNCLLGNGAGRGVSSTGSDNCVIGYNALYNVTTGAQNSCLGRDSGHAVTTGSNNSFIGYQAGQAGSPSGNITTTSNIIVLGNGNISSLYCNDTSISSSDQRDKTDIVNFTHGLNWVNQLKPVSYRWDKRCWYDDNTPDGSKKQARKHIGFLAQDVLAIEGNPSSKDDMLVVNLNEDDTAYGLKYERLVPVLVNAIKELVTKNDALETRIAALEAA